jgi:hypothetical protein
MVMAFISLQACTSQCSRLPGTKSSLSLVIWGLRSTLADCKTPASVAQLAHRMLPETENGAWQDAVNPPQ